MIVATCEGWLLTGKEPDRILWGNGNVLYLDLGGSYIGETYVKILQAVYLRFLHFIAYNVVYINSISVKIHNLKQKRYIMYLCTNTYKHTRWIYNEVYDAQEKKVISKED